MEYHSLLEVFDPMFSSHCRFYVLPSQSIHYMGIQAQKYNFTTVKIVLLNWSSAIIALLIFCSVQFSVLEGKQLPAILLVFISSYFYAIVVAAYIEMKLENKKHIKVKKGLIFEVQTYTALRRRLKI